MKNKKLKLIYKPSEFERYIYSNMHRFKGKMGGGFGGGGNMGGGFGGGQMPGGYDDGSGGMGGAGGYYGAYNTQGAMGGKLMGQGGPQPGQQGGPMRRPYQKRNFNQAAFTPY